MKLKNFPKSNIPIRKINNLHLKTLILNFFKDSKLKSRSRFKTKYKNKMIKILPENSKTRCILEGGDGSGLNQKLTLVNRAADGSPWNILDSLHYEPQQNNGELSTLLVETLFLGWNVISSDDAGLHSGVDFDEIDAAKST